MTKRVMTTSRLFLALFAIALFTMAVRETVDPDMWWHLRTGEFILDQGLPRQDIFSFTVPDHEWITHEWLSQVFMWATVQLAGLPGLMILFALLVALSSWLVYSCCAGRPYLAAFVTLLAAFASAMVWGARPQIFNLVFAAAFVYIIERVKDQAIHSRILWLLPLLTVLWANLHSGYLLGIALLAAYAVGESLQRWLGREYERTLSWSNVRLLALVMIVAFLLAIVNPNGPELWIYPFFTLGSPAMQAYIQEWQSPNFHLAHFWPFGLMLMVGVASWVLSPRRPTWTDLLLFGGTGAASLLSSRNIPLFAIVSAPIICRHLYLSMENTQLPNQLAESATVLTPSKTSIIFNWIILMLMIAAAALWTGAKVMGNEAAIADRYPVAAVDYLERAGLATARGYNSYNWGGYLIWRQIPVFIDGRADVYGDDFLSYYRKTFDVTEDWRRPLDEFDVEFVLMEHGSALSVLLDTSGPWREAYADDIAQLFVRETTLD